MGFYRARPPEKAADHFLFTDNRGLGFAGVSHHVREVASADKGPPGRYALAANRVFVEQV